MQVKYPNVKVQLSSQDGNAMSIIARVRKALRRADVPNDEVEQFSREAMSDDYDNVIQTAMKWVDVS
jgi:hypothetical protein